MKPRKPLKRGKPPRAKKPISRSGKRLVRQALRPSRTRIRAKGKPRFKRGRSPEYLTWIRGLPCALLGLRGAAVYQNESGSLIRVSVSACPHQCSGPTEAAHVKSRGAGGADRGNTIPLCRPEHNRQHAIGIKVWSLAWYPEGLAELRRIAAETYPREYEKYLALGFPE